MFGGFRSNEKYTLFHYLHEEDEEDLCGGQLLTPAAEVEMLAGSPQSVSLFQARKTGAETRPGHGAAQYNTQTTDN